MKEIVCAILQLNIPDKDSYGVLPEKRSLFEKNAQKNLIKEKIKPDAEIIVTKGCALLINSKLILLILIVFQKNIFYFGKKSIYVENF